MPLPKAPTGRISIMRYAERSIRWQVEVLDHRVVKELDGLAADLRQRFVRISELIQEHGMAAMREPYVKHLEGRLWEMRMRGKDGIARAVFVIAANQRAVVVHAFVKKAQRTPRGALETARMRAREVT
jgi:phage-related protein